MKKILLIALAICATSTMYADKKNEKGKSCAKTCAHGEAKAGTNNDGTVAIDPANSTTSTAPAAQGCCKKNTTAGKSCCAKKEGSASSSTTPSSSSSSSTPTAAPSSSKTLSTK